MDGIDALLTPTTQTAAIPVDKVDQASTPAHFTRFVQLPRAVRTGGAERVHRSRLPLSLQIVCRGYDEATALRIGWAYQAGDRLARAPPARDRLSPASPPKPCRACLALSPALGYYPGDERSADRRPAALQPRGIHRFRAVARAQALDRGKLRLCAGARRDFRLEAAQLRALLSLPQGQRGGARRGVLAHHRDAARDQARRRDGGGVHRAADHLSRPLEIPARHRHDRAGRHRRPLEAPRGAAKAARRRRAVRGRAQAETALSAGGDRHRHLALRRGDSRHPAPAFRPFPAPGAAVAGIGPGRGRGRPGRGGDRGFNRLPERAPCRGPT